MWRKERPDLPDPKPHTPRYECAGCKCLMETAVKFVERTVVTSKYLDAYCGKCAPSYDKVDEFLNQYYKMMPVNADGIPLVTPDAKKSK